LCSCLELLGNNKNEKAGKQVVVVSKQIDW
jgi:hypothetical protein